MELREAVIMRQHYRMELAASLRRYRWLKAGGDDPQHTYTDADEIVSQEAERATFLRQQLDRVSRWVGFR